MVKTRAMRMEVLKARPEESSLPSFIILDEEIPLNNGEPSIETDPSEPSNTEVGEPSTVQKPTEGHSEMSRAVTSCRRPTVIRTRPLMIRTPIVPMGRKSSQEAKETTKGKGPAETSTSHKGARGKGKMSSFEINIMKKLEAMEKRAIAREEKNKKEFEEMMDKHLKRTSEAFSGAEEQADLQYEHTMLQFLEIQKMLKNLRKRMMSEFHWLNENVEHRAEEIMEHMFGTDEQIAQIQSFLGSRLGP